MKLPPEEEAILELGPSGLCVIVDHSIALINRRLEEMLGFPSSEMIGRPFSDFVDETDRKRLIRLYRDHLSGQRNLGIVETRLKRRDDTKIDVTLEGGLIARDGLIQEVVVINDISAQKKTTESLAAAQSQYRALVEQSHEIIGLLRGDEIVYLNPAGRQLLGGISTIEAPRRRWSTWLHASNKRIWGFWTADVLKDGATRTGTIRLQIPPRKRRDIEACLSKVVVEGEPLIQVVARDITHEKNAQRNLERKDAILREIVQSSMDAVVAIGHDGRIRIFNPAAEKIFGWSTNEIVGQSVSMLIPEHLRTTHEQYVREFFTTEKSRGAMGSTLELTGRRRDGSRVPIELSLSSGTAGSHRFVMAVIRDVTDRKKAVHALKESDSRFRILFDQANDASYLFSLDDNGVAGSLQAVNEAAIRRLKYDREEFRGMSPMDLLEPTDDESNWETVVDALMGTGAIVFEREEIAKDGRKIPVEISAHRFSMEGRSTVLFVTRDITERRKSDEARRRIQTELEETVRARTRELQAANAELESQLEEKKRIERELMESERTLTALIGNLPGMAYRCPPVADRTLTYASRGCAALTGFTSQELALGSVPYASLIHPEDRGSVAQTIAEAVGDCRAFRCVYRLLEKTGREKWVLEEGRVVTDREKRPVSIEGFVTDITDRKEYEDHLRSLATRDFLTGLFTRRHFAEELERHFRDARDSGIPFVLCLGDIDHFKDINDRFGHRAGDQVLERFGFLARREIGPEDFAGRFGGDEFALAFPRRSLEKAVECVERIRSLFMKEAFERFEQGPISPSVSFGVVLLETHHRSEQDLLDHADRLLYRAKESGRNRTVMGGKPLWTQE